MESLVLFGGVICNSGTKPRNLDTDFTQRMPTFVIMKPIKYHL